MRKSLLITCHPRSDSLTAAVAEAFAAKTAGVTFERADLYAEGFDPRLGPDDEPDWGNARKPYSSAVRAEMARIERNQATVMVFPIWWWSMPAMLKGWIDRVWNHGWAYGDRSYPHRWVWLLAIGGSDLEIYRKRGYDRAAQCQLEVGILEYCGVAEPRLELLLGSLESEDRVAQILRDAGRLGEEFARAVAA
jgi:NAD(P)H dehydrogenase (quinone)